MATKSGLQSTIATLDNGGLNSAFEVRGVLGALLGNAYGEVATDNQSTETYTTRTTNFNYSLKLIKQGKFVSIKGSITNISGAIQGIGAVVFTFKTGDYLPISSFGQQFLYFSISGANLITRTNIGSGQSVEIDEIYIVND